MSINVVSRAQVKDYNTWLPKFEAAGKFIKEAGGKHLAVYRDAESPNTITVLSEFADLEKAKKFYSSEKTMERITRSGVIGNPQIHFVTDQNLF